MRAERKAAPMETVSKREFRESPAEQRVVLRNVSWELYEEILESRGDAGAPRLAYDRGILEIMSPDFEHEETAISVAQVVQILAEEKEIEIRQLGHATLRREDLERGIEPDACYYVENEPLVRGKKKLDFTVDPPPDLVVEVDITSPSLNKLPIYAALGVPEVWRHDGEQVRILLLRGGEYVEVAESAALPPLTVEALTRFVREGAGAGYVAWVRGVRSWVRDRARGKS